MSKTIKKDPNENKLADMQKLRQKLNDRKQQILRLKRTIVEMDKKIEKLTELLRCYDNNIEYKPKDISRPKKLTPEEKQAKKQQQEKQQKEDIIKKMKEKFGRKNNES
jgi:aldehyde:ferredoxin oxidoreductase